jgi:hypothetical protein
LNEIAAPGQLNRWMAFFSRHLCVMQHKITTKTIPLITVLAIVTGLTLTDTHSQQPTGPLPDALQTIIETKQETIKQTLDDGPESEWAGNYYSQDGLAAGTVLSWHPNVGFVVRWSTCSHGWRESANYGAAILKNGTLTLSPDLTGSDGSVYQVARTLVPVLWDQQHYFVWSDRLINFCYAVQNSNNAPEVDAFFLKDVDRDKRRDRLPNVPAEYRKYLFREPIIATISEVKPSPQPWIKEFTLNVGTGDGVVPEMKFYAFGSRTIYMLVEILNAAEHSSHAYVITSGFRHSDKNVVPKVGWKLTNRAPRDASNYYPG